MILRRLIILGVVVAGLAVSGVVVVVGLISALYSLLAPSLGAAGATAVLVGVVAAAMAGGAGALYAMSRPKKVVAVEARVEAQPSPANRVVDALADTVRERPVVVILAAVGAGVLAIRNPRYLASALRAFMAPREVED